MGSHRGCGWFVDRADGDMALKDQAWAGMDGAVAFHLIDRHAEGWDDIRAAMEAWLHANCTASELLDVAQAVLETATVETPPGLVIMATLAIDKYLDGTVKKCGVEDANL